jgi:hypothetical protein
MKEIQGMDNRKHAVILAMIESLASHGCRTGKVHVIKGLGLGSLAGFLDIPFEFFLYKHGPYSTDIEQNLEEMVSYDGIRIEPAFDGWGVILKPSENAAFIKKQAALPPAQMEGIQRGSRFLKGKNATQLERLATAMWIRKRLGIEESDDVAAKLHELKPHVTVQDAREADREIVAFLSNGT